MENILRIDTENICVLVYLKYLYEYRRNALHKLILSKTWRLGDTGETGPGKHHYFWKFVGIEPASEAEKILQCYASDNTISVRTQTLNTSL